LESLNTAARTVSSVPETGNSNTDVSVSTENKVPSGNSRPTGRVRVIGVSCTQEIRTDPRAKRMSHLVRMTAPI